MTGGLKKWILVADDEKKYRENICAFIELYFGNNIKIIQAKDGVDATSRLPFQSFDCILTDLRMPNKEGPAFIKSVRESELNAKTPVIVLTAFDGVSVQDSFEHVHLLEKPCPSKDVVDLVEVQLQLGKTDNRVAADLLNTVVSSSIHFIEQAIGGAEQNSAFAKIRSEVIQGDYWRSFTIGVGRSKNNFVIGFDKEFLSQLQGGENDHKANAAADIIVRHAVSEMESEFITVDERLSLVEGSAGFKDVTRQKGITIPVTCDGGYIWIHALWPES